MLPETLLSSLKLTMPPLATWVGGVVATNHIELDPNVIYPILGACAVAIWRHATFVKGVQDAIKSADEDRQKMAKTIDRMYEEQQKQADVVKEVSSSCPALTRKGDTCHPFPES